MKSAFRLRKLNGNKNRQKKFSSSIPKEKKILRKFFLKLEIGEPEVS